MLAITLTIPDWIFHWPFWVGYVAGVLTPIIVIMWAGRNWSLFG